MTVKQQRFHPLFSRRVILIGSALALLSIAGSVFMSRAFAATPDVNNDERLVTVHDGENEVTIVTRAATVKKALEQANISVASADIVEPAQTEQLVAQSYQVNIYRARPVVVIDGQQRIRVMTAEQSPRQIAEAAGITLYDEDRTTLTRVDDVLNSGGAGLQMTIDRATVFSLSLYGKTFEARTQATTVGGLLSEKGITLGAKDGVSPAQSASIQPGMTVRIWRDGKQTITVGEKIKRPIEEIQDPDLSLGVRKVQTEGKDGKKNVTYEIEMKGGKEVSRKKIASVTTLEAVKQVVVVGTKVVLPAGSHSDWMAAAGIASSDYGYVDYIISHESGWAATKSNYAGSGAYGLCQALPGNKMSSAGSDWATNPITQLKWCNGYAVGRYGSWAAAYSFWISNHWW